MNALIVAAILGVVMMFAGIITKQKSYIRLLAIAGLIVVLFANVLDSYGVHFFSIPLSGMLHFDKLSYFFTSIVLACTLIFFLLSAKDLEKVGFHYSEYFALIFFILCGIILVSAFGSLLILFLGIEIISIPLYILTGSDKKNLRSNEASLKYFLLGAFSTGLMLMGITMFYGSTGSFSILNSINVGAEPTAMLIVSILLLVFSMSFKVSAAPFHFWTPDVYDGAPTVITSFMATIAKAAAFIAFIRLFYLGFGNIQTSWQWVIAVITAITLIIGNLTAVFQQSVKRMLAYSSIAQVGFMMMAILSLNTFSIEGILLYTAAYSIATLGIFSVLAKMKDYSFEAFNGFAKHQPIVAFSMTVFLLSLAGIPLTAGFLSKFYMLKSVMLTEKFLWLIILAVLMAAVSIYYYFRLIQVMYFKEGGEPAIEISSSFKWLLAVLAALVILLGIYPQLLFNWFYF